MALILVVWSIVVIAQAALLGRNMYAVRTCSDEAL
jgi:hypothetical protein